MTEKQQKGALVGAGRVSVFHLRAWEQISQASIITIADTDRDLALQRGKGFGISPQHIYPSFEALLEKETKLDFVDIATPPNTHSALVRLAVEKGLHITCQKPFAYSLKEAREMIQICDQAGVLFNIHENWRWRSWYREIKARLDDGEIGIPHYARFSIYSDHWVNPENRTMLNQRGHGSLLEWGIHHIDLMRFLFGEVKSVFARTHHFVPRAKYEQHAFVTCVFHSGMTAQLDLNSGSYAPWGNVRRHGPMVEDVRIEGNQGAMLLIPDPQRGDLFRLVTQNAKIQRSVYDGTPQDAYQSSYTAAHQHFIDHLLSGEKTETHASDNFETLAVTLAAYRSAETNQVVNIDAFKRGDV